MLEVPIHTFADHVAVGVQLSPHGLILDWWRRVEWAEAELLNLAGLRYPHGAKDREPLIAKDPRLGQDLAFAVAVLRRRRNKVAHELHHAADRAEAAAYAEEALRVLGVFARAY